MAKAQDPDDIIPGRYFGKYWCSENHSWISINAGKRKRKKTCREHKIKAEVEIHRPLRKSDIPEDKRLFGKFLCDRCGNEWPSANAWKGYTQDCSKCHTSMLTWNLYYLRRGEKQYDKRHLQEYCGKCKQLNHSCLNRKK